MMTNLARIAATSILWLVTSVSGAQIELERSGATDLEIENAVNHELRVSGVTSQIHDRIATLEGSVQSQADKDRAEWIARRVPGVAAVHNEIVIAADVAAAAHAGNPLPGAVDAAVQARLAADERFAGSDIDVRSSDDNVVTLTGKVPSEEERVLAGRVAADTQAVAAVRNRLVVSD